MTPTPKTGWWPSRKWWAATILAAGTLAASWAQAGHWSPEMTVAAIGLVIQRATAWLLPNANTEDDGG